MTAAQEHALQQEIRSIRKRLISDGACPFDIAAAALAMVERLQQENSMLKAVPHR